MRVLQAFAFLLCWVFSMALAAAETKYILQFGIEGGGDKLAETTKYDISAAGGFYLGGGLSLVPRASAIAYELTVGYLFDSVEYDIPKGESSFDTIAFDFTVRKILGAHQVGGGATFHLDPALEQCEAIGGCQTFQFNSALGLNLIYTYSFQSVFITGKYTFMNYSWLDIDVNADSIGFYLGVKI